MFTFKTPADEFHRSLVDVHLADSNSTTAKHMTVDAGAFSLKFKILFIVVYP